MSNSNSTLADDRAILIKNAHTLADFVHGSGDGPIEALHEAIDRLARTGLRDPDGGSSPTSDLAYVMEYGAISLPLGHPSRVTCSEVHGKFSEAAAAAAACEFDARVYPITVPDPTFEPR
jgi:hypothetical protein